MCSNPITRGGRKRTTSGPAVQTRIFRSRNAETRSPAGISLITAPAIRPFPRTSATFVGKSFHDLLQTGAEAFAFGFDSGQKAGLGESTEDFDRDRARHGVRPERGGVISGVDGVCHRLFQEGRADREPACKRFCERHDVGLNAVVLVTEERTGSTEPALDLVEDQQGLHLVAQVSEPPEEIRFRQMDAALRLEGLYENGDGLGVHQLFDRFDVVQIGERDVGQKGLESLVELGLSRGRDGPVRAPVKGIVHRDELALGRIREGLVPPLAGELQRRLDRFRPAVAKERPIGEGAFAKHAGQFGSGNGMVEVGDVDELTRLPLHRLQNCRIVVSEGVHRQTADEVQVSLAVGVQEMDAFTPLQDEIRAPVGLQDVFLLEFDDFMGIHVPPSRDDFRADPFVREDLHQEGMGQPAIDDMCFVYATFHGPDTRLNLGNHAAAHRLVTDEAVDLPEVKRGDPGSRVPGSPEGCR